MKTYKDWICRYYSEHEDGEPDGEIIQELIRCKECAFYDSEHMCVAFSWMHGKPIKIAKNADDYCSLAERKDNGNDTKAKKI